MGIPYTTWEESAEDRPAWRSLVISCVADVSRTKSRDGREGKTLSTPPPNLAQPRTPPAPTAREICSLLACQQTVARLIRGWDTA